jgi:hypothetical protein
VVGPHANRVLLVFTLTSVPATAAPPHPGAAVAETRREQWEELRRAKLRALQPPQTSFLERAALEVEKAERPSLAARNLGGFYPRFTSIGWGAHVGAGVRFWQPDIGDSRFDVHGSAAYSIRRYESYQLQAGFLPHRGRQLPRRAVVADGAVDFADELHRGQGPWLGYASVRYHHLPEVDFYGLGNQSLSEDRTTFLQQDALYDLVLAYQPTERSMLMVRSGYLQVFVGPGRDDDVPSLEEVFPATPGLQAQPDFVHLTGFAALDGRDQPGNPHRGAFLAVSATRFDDRDGDAYRFDRFAADARAFLPLGSPQRVLALRGVATTDRAADGAQVPFYMQHTLGGSHTLRGYRSFRFRGERMLLLQAEYRWEANPAVELALFVDSGRAAAAEEGWSLDDMHTSWGVGLRVKTFDEVRFRFDVAWSEEGTRVMVRLGPSF